MDKKIELLAPGGDIKSIKAAILAGADAVYCGLDKFNARNRAENISFNDLNGILNLAHKNNCEVFLTVNIIIVESELPAFVKLLNKLVNTSIDGVIVQYRWNFGDGSSGMTTTPITNHPYQNSSGRRRTYNISLQVVDDDGEVNQTRRTVDVDPAS